MITSLNIFLILLNAFLSGFNYSCWKDLGKKENLYAGHFGAFTVVFIFVVQFMI